MKIEVNVENNHALIIGEFNRALVEIKLNAKLGKNTTELYIDNAVAYEVKQKLKAEVENIEFCIVNRRTDPNTGRVSTFEGRVEGDNRYYKVRLV